MAKETLKTFVVQLEWADSWVDMTDEEMGMLFRNFIAYSKGEELNLENRFVKSSWLSVVKQIDRMNKKYFNDVENGKKGGAPIGNTNAKKLITEQPKNNPETTPIQPVKQAINININKNINKNANTNEVISNNNKFINYAILDSDLSLKNFYVENKNDIEFLITQGYTLEQSLSIHEDAIKCSIFK